MKLNWLFFLGATIDGFILLASISYLLMMRQNFENMNGASSSPMEELPAWIGLLLWLIPLALLALIGGAFWLKSNGKMLAANILLWIPALPMLAMILFWAGLALLFILFGK